jgi:ABC-type Co2+ transport system permease subunit
MQLVLTSSVLAVHIADGILADPWWAGGFAGATVLLLFGAWGIRDEEIPQVALLTAAFFVASLAHVSIAGVTSVHLLFNGLVGVVLGRRAALAIPLGVFLQAVLFGHGGLSTLGINSCILTLPALLAWRLFAGMQRVPWVRRPWFRAALVALSTLTWTLGLVYSLVLLATNYRHQVSNLDVAWAERVTFHPLTLAAAFGLAALAAWGERQLENAPEFPLGMLIGELAVLATTFLNCCVLVWGGREDWPSLVLATLVPHLAIAVVEGIVLGFTIGFLARVKPDMLKGLALEKSECLVDSLP